MKGGVIMQKKLIMIIILIGALVLLLTIPSWFSVEDKKAELTKDIDLVAIDVSGVSTTIVPVAQKYVQADLDGKGSVSIKKHRDSITVKYNRKWHEQLPSFEKTQLTIYIPESYNRDLQIEIGSGKLHFAGGADDVKLNQLLLDVHSGNIVLDSVQAKEGEIDVRSGNVNVQRYTGKLDAEVSSGNLNVQIIRLTDSVRAEVNSGQVILQLPDKADFALDGQVSSGLISSDFNLKNKVEDNQELKGRYGSGKHSIDINVSSGRAEIIH